jgi:hypothetical protein
VNDNIEIKCPNCKVAIFVDIWRIKSSHKIFCRKCNKFFNLQISGKSPYMIKSEIEKEIKKYQGDLNERVS